MRLDKFGLAVVLAIAIAGCQWLPTKDDPRVVAVIELVKEGCKFEVERDSVVAMLAAANPAFTGVGPLADAICNAVNKATETKAAPKEGTCPFGEVNGVCIQGHKVD